MRIAFASLLAAAMFPTVLIGAPVPDFKLMDVNPNSARHDAPVSPRDYVLQVSGYYFGAAH